MIEGDIFFASGIWAEVQGLASVAGGLERW
jgi:hypothetical protein